MSKILVLYNYNKYYNRIVKRLSTYNEYKALITPVGNTPAQHLGFEITKVNFNFADGIYTKHIIDLKKDDPVALISSQPDYLVLEEEYKTGENTSETIVSRWFVLEADRTRRGQYELTLRRDLLADYWSEVINAPVFIEKGFPHRSLGLDDPAIFNRENMTYNQIKKDELLLNFNKLSGKGGGWIVGYIAKEADPNNPTSIGTNEDPCIGRADIPPNIPNFSNLPAKLQTLINLGSGYLYKPNELYLRMPSEYYNYDDEYHNMLTYLTSDGSIESLHVDYNFFNLTAMTKFYYGHNWSAFELYFRTQIVSGIANQDLVSKFINLMNNDLLQQNIYAFTEDNLLNYNNSYYKFNNKYYQIKIIANNNLSGYERDYLTSQINAGSDALSLAFKNVLNYYLIDNIHFYQNTNAAANKKAVEFYNNGRHYTITSQEVDFTEVKVVIPAMRNNLLDAPYDMFCIPLGTVSVIRSGSVMLTTNQNDALAMARGIALKGTSQRIYDIQILPYCPVPEVINSDGNIDITGLNENDFTNPIDFTFIERVNDSALVNIVLYPLRSKGTFNIDIPTTSPVYDKCSEITDSILEKKVAAETEFVRFVSPNFASIFEINVQKNKGIVNLNVDYFYKPYSPYLHVAPYFAGLYGNDYNDPKGLICSGDFSISTAASMWEQYQIQNKNYELIFNRQIENLDVNNKITYEQQSIASGIGIASSGLSGAAAGALVGSMILPGIGTAIGAAVGGGATATTSAVGRKYDLEYLKKSQTEARSYAVDMYAYNLGNVKALPTSITKVTTLTENFKIFPFLEFYDCTEEEKEALREKIKYNGMTIMRIGKIIDFRGGANHFVSGQLIRLEGINEDSHVIAEIANEIKEGAYFYGSDTE